MHHGIYHVVIYNTHYTEELSWIEALMKSGVHSGSSLFF